MAQPGGNYRFPTAETVADGASYLSGQHSRHRSYGKQSSRSSSSADFGLYPDGRHEPYNYRSAYDQGCDPESDSESEDEQPYRSGYDDDEDSDTSSTDYDADYESDSSSLRDDLHPPGAIRGLRGQSSQSSMTSYDTGSTGRGGQAFGAPKQPGVHWASSLGSTTQTPSRTSSRSHVTHPPYHGQVPYTTGMPTHPAYGQPHPQYAGSTSSGSDTSSGRFTSQSRGQSILPQRQRYFDDRSSHSSGYPTHESLSSGTSSRGRLDNGQHLRHGRSLSDVTGASTSDTGTFGPRQHRRAFSYDGRSSFDPLSGQDSHYDASVHSSEYPGFLPNSRRQPYSSRSSSASSSAGPIVRNEHGRHHHDADSRSSSSGDESSNATHGRRGRHARSIGQDSRSHHASSSDHGAQARPAHHARSASAPPTGTSRYQGRRSRHSAVPQHGLAVPGTGQKRFTADSWYGQKAYRSPHSGAERDLRKLFDAWPAVEANRNLASVKFPFRGSSPDEADDSGYESAEPVSNASRSSRASSYLKTAVKHFFGIYGDSGKGRTRGVANSGWTMAEAETCRIHNSPKLFVGYAIYADGSELWWRLDRIIAKFNRPGAFEARIVKPYAQDRHGLTSFSNSIGREMAREAMSMALGGRLVGPPTGLKVPFGNCQAIPARLCQNHGLVYPVDRAAMIYNSHPQNDKLGFGPDLRTIEHVRPGDILRLRDLTVDILHFSPNGQVKSTHPYHIGQRQTSGHVAVVVGVGDAVKIARRGRSAYLDPEDPVEAEDCRLISLHQSLSRTKHSPCPRYLQIVDQSKDARPQVRILDLNSVRDKSSLNRASIRIVRPLRAKLVTRGAVFLGANNKPRDRYRSWSIIKGCPDLYTQSVSQRYNDN